MRSSGDGTVLRRLLLFKLHYLSSIISRNLPLEPRYICLHSGRLPEWGWTFGTILAFLIALLGLITIAGAAWGLFKIFQNIRLLFLLDEG